MVKSSFKTRDPFVILEHFDGQTSVHLASLILIVQEAWAYRECSRGESGAECKVDGELYRLAVMLIVVHSIAIFCQLANLVLRDRESDVVRK